MKDLSSSPVPALEVVRRWRYKAAVQAARALNSTTKGRGWEPSPRPTWRGTIGSEG